MFWKRKNIEYEILAPPLSKNVHSLNDAEAKAHFEWFISKLDERTEYLRQFTKINLDYSPESLVSLWAWFLKNARWEKTQDKRLREIENQLIAAKSPLIKEILEDSKYQFTLVTEYMIRDIGMYFGQVFVKNYPTIYWGYEKGPKRYAFANHPALYGFPNEVYPERAGVPLEPIHIVRVRALRLIEDVTRKHDLLDLYRVWEDKILNG